MKKCTGEKAAVSCQRLPWEYLRYGKAGIIQIIPAFSIAWIGNMCRHADNLLSAFCFESLEPSHQPLKLEIFLNNWLKNHSAVFRQCSQNPVFGGVVPKPSCRRKPPLMALSIQAATLCCCRRTVPVKLDCKTFCLLYKQIPMLLFFCFSVKQLHFCHFADNNYGRARKFSFFKPASQMIESCSKGNRMMGRSGRNNRYRRFFRFSFLNQFFSNKFGVFQSHQENQRSRQRG